MLRAQPPTTRTSAPGVSARNGATARQASGRLSLALATAVGAIPSGSATSIASANGTRTRSASAPPQSPPIGFMPYAAPGPAVRHEPVSPRVHRSHRPQEIWNGTTTRSPRPKRPTASPVSTTSATNSCPSGNGPPSGTRPVDDRVIQVARRHDERADERIVGRLDAWVRHLFPPNDTGLDEREL